MGCVQEICRLLQIPIPASGGACHQEFTCYRIANLASSKTAALAVARMLRQSDPSELYVFAPVATH